MPQIETKACSVTIAVPTFRRPDRLRKLLNAVLDQVRSSAEASGIEVLIVDNCPDATARDVVAEFESPVRYVHESRPGVANARNMAVAEAHGEYLIFIDDDEMPRQGWLNAFLGQASQGAKASFGPVEPVFEAPPAPELLPALDRLFSRRLSAKTGQDISESRAWLGTGNSLFRVSDCFPAPDPFDANFNDGGEDVWFLRGLVEDRKIALTWCADAVVDEIVPASRMTLDYIKARVFNNGRLRCIVERGSGTPGSLLKTAFWMVIGAGQFTVYGVAATVLRPLARARATGFEIRSAGGLGKLLWWR